MAMVFPGGPVEIHYLFVDGGCLRSATRPIFERYTGSPAGGYFEIETLRANHSKVFYYDAVPAQEHNEEREAWIERIIPQTNEFAKIRSLSRFHVQLGDLRGRAGNQRQKRVDVQITVDMLLHTFRGNMAKATLLAGDIDFQPLLEALIREGMFVDLLHPQHASAALVDAADSGRVMTAASLATGLRHSDGSALLASIYDNIRPRGEHGDVMHAWSEDHWRLELRKIHGGGGWLLERFDPTASATSLQFRGQHLKAVMATAHDTYAISGDASVSELIQRFDGVVL